MKESIRQPHRESWLISVVQIITVAPLLADASFGQLAPTDDAYVTPPTAKLPILGKTNYGDSPFLLVESQETMAMS
jgi:hypothetical protein